jgi:hypothetical protein
MSDKGGPAPLAPAIQLPLASDGTIKGYNVALNVLLDYLVNVREAEILTLNEFVPDHLSDGKLETFMSEFGMHLTTLLKRDGKPFALGTLKDYFSSVKMWFSRRTVFDGHWGKVDASNEPIWYSVQREDIRRAHERNSVANGGDFRKSLPLYQEELSGHAMGLFKNQQNSTEDMEKRFMLLLNFHAAARGGEVKFLDWGEAYYDKLLQCLVFNWKEIKTGHQYPMPIVQSGDFTGCAFHALACMCAVGGLVRSVNTLTLNRRSVFQVSVLCIRCLSWFPLIIYLLIPVVVAPLQVPRQSCR